MPTQANLMGSGCPALQAQASVGMPSLSQTATGSSQTDAFLLPSDAVMFSTVASNTGAKLPANANLFDSYIVVNHGANTLKVYPNSAGGKIANGSAGAAFSVGTLKTASFLYLGSDNWAASLSA